MKKILYAILLSTIFWGIGISDVKADEFDYNTCTINCRNAGDQYNNCMAGCDARKLVEEKKEECGNNSFCVDRWENAYSIKLEYYIEYYTNSSNGFNYSRFNYDECNEKCMNSGSGYNYCKSDCNARKEVQDCIIEATTSTSVQMCKNNYNNLYQDYINNNSDEVSNTYRKVQCGDVDIPYVVPQMVRVVILILQIATPLIIIFLGSLDLVKAVMAQKEDEIKKGQQTFLRRLLIGIIVFLAFFIVEVVIGLVAPKSDSDNENMWNCVDCFINGDCDIK